MRYSKKVVKISLIMIVGGLLIAMIGYFMGGTKDLAKNRYVDIVLGNEKHIVKSAEIEDFKNLELDVDLDYVEIVKGDKNKIELNYNENLEEVNYKIENETLMVSQKPMSEGMFSINLDLRDRDTNPCYMKLYIKEDKTLENIRVNLRDTDLKINEIKSKSIDANVEHGNVIISRLDSDNTNIEIEDGDINIENIKTNKMDINNYHGDIKSDSLQCNNFKIYSEDGEISLTRSTFENADIENKHGNVDLSLLKREERYNYYIQNKHGDIKIDQKPMEQSVYKDNNGENTIKITSEDGDIDMRFVVSEIK